MRKQMHSSSKCSVLCHRGRNPCWHPNPAKHQRPHLKWIEARQKVGHLARVLSQDQKALRHHRCIVCSLYKFRKQRTDFLGARGQTTFKMLNWWVANVIFLLVYISKKGLWIALERLLDSSPVIIVYLTMLLLILLSEWDKLSHSRLSIASSFWHRFSLSFDFSRL
jgi:hypothetical protein